MQSARKLGLLAASFAAALVLAACGGGGGSEPPRTSISRVVVAGDSLADVGVTGIKFTIQNSADAKGFPIFPEIVAANFGVTGQCNFFTLTAATNAGCTNFAVGGGRVYHSASATDIQNVPFQLATAASVIGTYTDSDLVIVDGGSNDAGDVATAYIGILKLGAAAIPNFRTIMVQQLDPTFVDGLLATPTTGVPTLAGLYMQKLADTYYDAIKTTTLDKGATHVAVLNATDITLTPKFQQVLGSIATASGEAAAAQVQAAIRQWIVAFNTQLNARVGGDGRIALVDFYADIQDEIANPAAYGLTNATTPACPATGVDGSGLPTYTFATCTSAALDAAPPTGLSAGWWKTWAFSDSFHPTPFGHQLLAASVSRAIARAGWL